jgi:hypothetical protein
LLQAIEAPDHLEASKADRVMLEAELRIHESTAPPAGCSADCQDQQILPKPKSLDSREPAA